MRHIFELDRKYTVSLTRSLSIKNRTKILKIFSYFILFLNSGIGSWVSLGWEEFPEDILAVVTEFFDSGGVTAVVDFLAELSPLATALEIMWAISPLFDPRLREIIR